MGGGDNMDYIVLLMGVKPIEVKNVASIYIKDGVYNLVNEIDQTLLTAPVEKVVYVRNTTSTTIK